METLNQRTAFYTNALERKVRSAFRPFLLSRLTPDAPRRAVPLMLPERKRPEQAKEDSRPAAFGPWGRKALYALLLLLGLGALFLLGKRL